MQINVILAIYLVSPYDLEVIEHYELVASQFFFILSSEIYQDLQAYFSGREFVKSPFLLIRYYLLVKEQGRFSYCQISALVLFAARVRAPFKILTFFMQFQLQRGTLFENQYLGALKHSACSNISHWQKIYHNVDI